MLIFSSTFSNCIISNAAYSQEKKHSIYTYQSVMANVYPNFKIKKDNRGYYATYNNHGYFEVYLGKSKNMYFSDFSKKLGGTTKRNVRTYKITKTEQFIKKHGMGLLIAYICTQAGCPWYASYVIGAAGDNKISKLLKEPGTYRMTTIVSSVKIRDGSIKNKPYTSTYHVHSFTLLEKKVGKKWKTISKTTKPAFVY